VSALRILGGQVKSIVVALLVAAASVSLASGDRIEAAAIGAVLAINTLIGFVTELRARRAMDALLGLDASRATVLRAGRLRNLGAEELVPGDVVRLDAGQRVPADARLLHATDLRTDEAALTGESLPVSKADRGPLPQTTPLADRTNVVFKGTTVAAGTATAVVSATGAATEIGRIGALVETIPETRTPLERRLDVLGRRLAWLAIGIGVLVAALAALEGAPVSHVVEIGIALAVAAVPEALPAVATIALAVGLRRMARRNALVRSLPAVEALGSTTVVCTDKTRTLTSGRMEVVRLWTAGGDFPLRATSEAWAAERVRAALETAVLASRPQPAAGADGAGGDPVDRAFLVAGERTGLARDRLAEGRLQVGWVPFSSERKLMASFHRDGDAIVAFVKGAPRQILEASGRVLGPGGVETLDDARRAELLAVNEAFARDGLRVLALATGPVAATDASALRDLTLVGIAGLADPPAPGVADAIVTLRGAGLRTVMLTGDQRLTAEAVGRELGLVDAGDRAVDARELDTLSDEELDNRLERTAAWSRITPEHKLMLVRRLQSRGEIVAMLGDGVNDAPALRQADVGVAMGLRGTDVAKEAADIVLGDDRFGTVAAAVEEGRVIFDNIRKFVFYLFSCNLAEVLVLLVAGVLGLPSPLLPLQVLWLNIVTDTFPALALALEPADRGVMARPPRDPQQALLSRRFLSGVGFYALLITASTLAAYLLALDGGEERARTVAFMTLSLAQVFHLGNARSHEAVLNPVRALANPVALAAVALSVSLQIAAVSFGPLAGVLRLAPLGAGDWALAAGLAALAPVTGQAIKVWRR
jgi:Ca2+-transporting ATPase